MPRRALGPVCVAPLGGVEIVNRFQLSELRGKLEFDMNARSMNVKHDQAIILIRLGHLNRLAQRKNGPKGFHLPIGVLHIVHR
jgi:hypothetical protein